MYFIILESWNQARLGSWILLHVVWVGVTWWYSAFWPCNLVAVGGRKGSSHPFLFPFSLNVSPYGLFRGELDLIQGISGLRKSVKMLKALRHMFHAPCSPDSNSHRPDHIKRDMKTNLLFKDSGAIFNLPQSARV